MAAKMETGPGSCYGRAVAVWAFVILAALAALVLSATAARAQSKEYYISAEKGKDGATGEKEAPFRTIQEGSKAAGHGDTVLIEPGEYQDALEFSRSGEENKPITYRVTGDKLAVLKPGDQRTDGIRIIKQSYLVVEGIDVVGPYDEGITIRDSHHVTIKRCKARGGRSGITFGPLDVHHVVFEDVKTAGNEAGGMDVWKDVNLSDCTFIRLVSHDNRCAGGTDGIGVSHKARISNIQFLRCTAYSNGMDGFDLSGQPAEGAKGTYILDGCVSRDNCTDPKGWGAGIKTWVPEVVIRNCLVLRNRHEGGIIARDNARIYNCVFSGNEQDHAINLAGDNVVLRNCIFYKERRAVKGKAETATLDHCLFFESLLMSLKNIGEGSREGVDPKFVAPDKDDYHLQEGSPAVDKGNPDGAPLTDLEGTPRPQGAGVDLGAYEFKK